MEDSSVRSNGAEWQVMHDGNGPKTWVVFHGFGQNALLMLRFMKLIRPNDRIISISLPFHGQTKTSSKHLKPDDLTDLLGRCLRPENIDRCSVLGYSLGAKAALKLVELSPGRIERLVLIAPDGLKPNYLHRFATGTFLGDLMFRRTMNNPAAFLAFSALARRLGIINGKLYSFFQTQLEKSRTRDMIYGSWHSFRNLTPDLVQIRKNIFRYKIETALFFGERDRIIPAKLAPKLSGDNVKTSTVHILKYGHDLTDKAPAEKIAEILNAIDNEMD